MKAKIKDTDYLVISARIRSLERNLLDRARCERMLEAPNVQEAARVLTEPGYREFDVKDSDSLNRALLQRRVDLFAELSGSLPDGRILDVFKLPYDYHNIKVLIKGGSESLLIDAGRIPAAELLRRYRDSGKWEFLPQPMASAAAEGQRVLAETGDAQRSDALVDRAYFGEMAKLAEESKCAYLVDYVRAVIDAANLRSVVRTLRLGRSAVFLREFLFAGGSVSVEACVAAAENGDVEKVYHASALRKAAQAGQEAVEAGGSLTEFEKQCDNAVLAQAGRARRIPFGAEVVIGYVAAREAELSAARIIMTGRMAGLSADAIRERLRESYV